MEEDSSVFDLVDKEEGNFAFCMCNPPFYANNLEAWSGNTRKDSRPEPNSVSTASPAESIVPGGEVNFVKRLIDDSLLLKTKIRYSLKSCSASQLPYSLSSMRTSCL